MTSTDERRIGSAFLAACLGKFKAQKSMVESAITQLADSRLHVPIDQHTNSIAVIMKHLAGNMISRWTNFLSTDGEKPDRRRDHEFIDDFASREALMRNWERGWNKLFETVGGLSPDDLLKTVRIRGYEHSVVDAIIRNLEHCGYHTGQIVQLARHFAGDDWETLTIARGESEAYNRRVWKK